MSKIIRPAAGGVDFRQAYPEFGRVRKGAPKGQKADGSVNKSGRGENLDYYRIELNERFLQYQDLLVELYGEKPAELPYVRFFSNVVAENFSYANEVYKGTKIEVRCDGAKIEKRWTGAGYDFTESPCHCGDTCDTCPLGCEAVGRLNFLLWEFSGRTGIYGYFTLITGSVDDINHIRNVLPGVLHFEGNLVNVPFLLTRQDETFYPVVQGKRITTTHSQVRLLMHPEYAKSTHQQRTYWAIGGEVQPVTSALPKAAGAENLALPSPMPTPSLKIAEKRLESAQPAAEEAVEAELVDEAWGGHKPGDVVTMAQYTHLKVKLHKKQTVVAIPLGDDELDAIGEVDLWTRLGVDTSDWQAGDEFDNEKWMGGFEAEYRKKGEALWLIVTALTTTDVSDALAEPQAADEPAISITKGDEDDYFAPAALTTEPADDGPPLMGQMVKCRLRGNQLRTGDIVIMPDMLTPTDFHRYRLLEKRDDGLWRVIEESSQKKKKPFHQLPLAGVDQLYKAERVLKPGEVLGKDVKVNSVIALHDNQYLVRNLNESKPIMGRSLRVAELALVKDGLALDTTSKEPLYDDFVISVFDEPF